jgi:hypothetical protein
VKEYERQMLEEEQKRIQEVKDRERMEIEQNFKK